MGRIFAIAINTFREAVRDRVLYGVLGVALFVQVFTLVLAEISLDQQRRVVLDVTMAAISLFSVLVAVFLGSSLLYKEIERKTLYVILPKPVERHEFLLGKFLGIILTAFVFLSVMGSTQMCVTALQADASPPLVLSVLLGMPALLGLAVWKARDRSAVVVPWCFVCASAATWALSTTDVPVGPIVAGLVLAVGEVMVLTSVALLFSSFSTPFLTALFTTGVWVTGRSADTMANIKSTAIPEAAKDLMRYLAEVWPNFHLFVPGPRTLSTALTAEAGPLSYVVTSMTYAAAYSAVLLFFAALIFRRRDFI